MDDKKDICQRLEKDMVLLQFGGMKRMADDVKEARELLLHYIGKEQQEMRPEEPETVQEDSEVNV